jgi:hypothetical protein
MLLSSSASDKRQRKSRSLHLCRTEIAEKTFATLVILLPSEFTDGSIHVSLDGETNVFDTSGVSSLQTTILAWHTGANHELVSPQTLSTVSH